MSRRNGERQQLKKCAKNKTGGKESRKKTRVLWWITLTVLLLAGLMRCMCSRSPIPTTIPAATTSATASASVPLPAVLQGGAESREALRRPQIPNAPENAEPWLDAFRLQVGARAPRLNACLGNLSGGAIRWSALLHRGRGSVSDLRFESHGTLPELNDSQRACFTTVLAETTYRIPTGAWRAADPQVRVSLVFEF